MPLTTQIKSEKIDMCIPSSHSGNEMHRAALGLAAAGGSHGGASRSSGTCGQWPYARSCVLHGCTPGNGIVAGNALASGDAVEVALEPLHELDVVQRLTFDELGHVDRLWSEIHQEEILMDLK